MQPNGKLVVGGGNGRDFALVRYLPDGSPDPVFDLDGTATTDFGRDEVVLGLAFRPGQLVAAGISIGSLPPSPSGPAAFAVARYRLDGTLDPTFDGDGKVLTDFDGRGAAAYDVVIQPDGKVVAVGGVDGGPNQLDFAVARFNQDGSPDPTFGAGGLVTTDFGSSDDASSVSLQEDSRIVVAGQTDLRDFALARYNPNGSLDNSFDGDGKVTINFSYVDRASDVAIQADSKIIVVGSTVPPVGDWDFALARLNPDGSLDTRGLDPHMDAPFGTGGTVTTDFAGGGDEATSLAIEPSGKILVAGLATPAPGQEGGDFGLARYHIDGSLDPSFGSGGKVTTRFSAGEDWPRGVVFQRDGRIVLAGNSGNTGPGSFDFALARYLVRGCCDVGGSPPGGPSDPPPLP